MTIIKEISISSKTSNLQIVREFVQEISKNCNHDTQTVADIVLAVDEACTNIIEHAYKNSDQGKIYLKLECKDGNLSIIIIDNGVEFNPNNVPKPNIEKYLKEKKSGGLGVYLMKQLMDEITYERILPSTNKLIMRKYKS